VAERQLRRVSPDLIRRNRDNPRLIFRQDELDALAVSIRRVGILVPLAVYEDGKRYVLIDGERRWKCAQKLSLPTVPVIVEPKPARLENILRMFDIHNVRSQWDLLAISLKLQQIQELLSEENKPNSPKDISVLTGLSLATVRRGFDLLTLPGKYLKLLRVELEKPKPAQQFSEDLFIEMRKALRVVAKYTPEVTAGLPPERLIDVFFGKYERKTIRNVVAFRKVSRIARSEKVGVPKDAVIPALRRLVEDPDYTIEQAYGESVEAFYEQREVLTSVRGLTARLDDIAETEVGAQALREPLENLRQAIDRILKKLS
jgi:ParB family transcriptional regulator, chromosome partitioning protein